MGKLMHVEVLAKEARDALAGLTGSDLSGLTDGEITELVVLTSEVVKLAEAAQVAVLGRLEVSGAWQGSGARSAAAWVAWQCHQSQTRSHVDATEARVLVHVLAGDQSVERMCELSDGTLVTPGEVLQLLDRADVARVIFDGPSRVLDVGVRQRLFTGATRTAVEMRDRFCQHPSCTVPAERCQIDHVVPYEEGGLTVQVNARCYCPFHHRWHHRQHPPAA